MISVSKFHLLLHDTYHNLWRSSQVNLNASFGESGRMGLSIFSFPFHVEKTTNYFNYLIFIIK
jgi:hypothetical protein